MSGPEAPVAEQTDEEAAAELEALRQRLITEGWSQPGTPTNVIQALARVMLELPGIGKDNDSEQGYKYRGIEAITAHAQQLLGRYCVVFIPRVVERVTKEFQINSRPWTEDQATITYTVYGPGGVDDHIEVGPLIALGRDNSDKGMNKCMTQAFKYALLQTLCIGDHKDDADGEEAHQGDAPAAQIDPDREARVQLSKRIRELSAAGRDELRAFCDGENIPRVTAQMTDEQLEQVTERLDAISIAAEQDAAAEAPQAPVAAPTGDEPPSDGTLPLEPPAADPGIVHAPEVIAHVRAVVKAQVEELEGDALKDACRDLELSIMGSEDAKRARLINARATNVLADPDDLATALAIELPAPASDEPPVADPAPEA